MPIAYCLLPIASYQLPVASCPVSTYRRLPARTMLDCTYTVYVCLIVTACHSSPPEPVPRPPTVAGNTTRLQRVCWNALFGTAREGFNHVRRSAYRRPPSRQRVAPTAERRNPLGGPDPRRRWRYRPGRPPDRDQ